MLYTKKILVSYVIMNYESISMLLVLEFRIRKVFVFWKGLFFWKGYSLG